MTEAFDGLCSLANKTGVCYQCKGLRDLAPDGRKGPEPPALPSLAARCEVAGLADMDGSMAAFHDVFWRRTAEIEADAAGAEVEAGDCGRGTE